MNEFDRVLADLLAAKQEQDGFTIPPNILRILERQQKRETEVAAGIRFRNIQQRVRQLGIRSIAQTLSRFRGKIVQSNVEASN